MNAEQKMLFWIPLVVLWLATMVVRLVPAVRDRFGADAQRFAAIVGWASVLAILAVVWLL